MDIRWPTETDKLFVSGDPFLARGTVWDGEISFAATGFKTAADDMVEQLYRGHTNNFWTFPIVFCYRHYLELTLKHLIELFYQYEGSDKSFPHTHNLWTLWEVVRDNCYEPQELVSDGEIPIVEKLIKEFQDFDSKSTAFRYAERVDLGRIELRNLSDVMDGLANHLNGLTDIWADAIYNKS